MSEGLFIKRFKMEAVIASDAAVLARQIRVCLECSVCRLARQRVCVRRFQFQDGGCSQNC